MTENAPDTSPVDRRPAPAHVVDVAERFLKIGGPMETAKLHSLLYLAQGHHLAITGRALLDEPIVAWPEGPVVASLHELHSGETMVSPGFFYDKLRKLDSSPTDEPAAAATESTGDYQAHIYDGGRCVFCDTNDLDNALYGPYECIYRGQFVYTTETPPPPASHSDV